MNKSVDIYKLFVFFAFVFNAALDLGWFFNAFAGEYVDVIYKYSGQGALVSPDFGWGLYLISLPFLYVGLLGMFFCHWLARPVILIFILISIIQAGISGLVIVTPVENFMFYLASVTLYVSTSMAFISRPILAMYRKSFREFIASGV